MTYDPNEKCSVCAVARGAHVTLDHPFSIGVSGEPLPPQYVLDALKAIGIERNPEHDDRPADEEPWVVELENGERPADSLADALDTMQRAAENDGRAKALEQLRITLKKHWLADVQCHHETRTDTAHCFCTIWSSGPLPSVGEAVDAWVQHVIEEVAK